MKNKLIIVLVAISLIGVTISYFTASNNLTNHLEIGDVTIENEEDFNPTPDQNGNVQKIVNIKNISAKTPCFVRVNITPRWVDENGKPWSGDVSDKVIKLNYYDESYKEEFEKNWLKGSDNYYYYKSILKPNQKTYSILQSVDINLKDSEGNNLVENPKDYEGKTLIIDVNSEAVQPTIKAYKDVWNVLDKNVCTMLDSLIGAN